MTRPLTTSPLIRAPYANRFCGPFAAGLITGRSPDDIEEVVLAWRKKHAGSRRGPDLSSVSGMSNYEMERVVEAFGYRLVKETFPQRVIQCGGLHIHTHYAGWLPMNTSVGPTLTQWMRKAERDPESLYLVTITGHFLLVRRNLITDNILRRWDAVERHSLRRRRVRLVQRVVRRTED